MISINDVVQTASDAIFNKPLVTNVYRSVLVEAMVAAALKDWRWCSADYASYDFEHFDGRRLEVKQSAMRQSWATAKTPKPSWDIKSRTAIWENGTTWIARPGRDTDIYVLALHPVTNDTADHRDAQQWRFYVIATSDLPPTQRISHPKASQMTVPVDIQALAAEVNAARLRLHD